MSLVLNLKEIERKAWISVFSDGLYDLWLGWLLLQMGGVYMLSKLNTSDLMLTLINLGTYGLSLVLLRLGKRYITLPRMGRVKFSPRRRSRVKLVTVITFVIVGVTFGLTLLSIGRQKSLLGEQVSPLAGPFLISLFFLVFFWTAAYFLEYRHLFLIGLMFALPEPVLAVLAGYLSIPFALMVWLIPVTIVISMGLVTLRRFLREHPASVIPAGGMDNEES